MTINRRQIVIGGCSAAFAAPAAARANLGINILDFIDKRLHSSIRRGSCTENLGDMINRALNSGAHFIEFPAGVYPTSVPIRPAPGISLEGEGHASEIRAIGTMENLLYLAARSLYGYRYASIGGLYLNGGKNVKNTFYIGLAVLSEFHNISISGGTDAGLIIDSAQNNSFQNINVEGSSVGIYLINGAASNIFTRIELSDCIGNYGGRASHLFIGTLKNQPGYLTRSYRGAPTENTFERCIFESQTPELTSPRVLVGSGRLNIFRDCDFGGNAALSASVLKGTAFTQFENCVFSGGGKAGSYAIRNDGDRTSVRGGLFESFADPAIIKSSTPIDVSGAAFGNPMYHVQELMH
jgi:hypothetical protein